MWSGAVASQVQLKPSLCLRTSLFDQILWQAFQQAEVQLRYKLSFYKANEPFSHLKLYILNLIYQTL